MIKFSKLAVVLLAIGLALAGCSSKPEKKAALDPFAGTGSPRWTGKGAPPWGGGRNHVGKPYQVAGRWFTPKVQPDYDKEGPASWYGEAFNHRQTSNGEWFDMTRLTAAHPTLPLPSYAKVTNLDNGKEVIVRINDRGPFVGPRIIDLSKRTAEVLDFKTRGKAQVRVQYIGPAPLSDNGKHLVAMNHELNRGTSLNRMIATADRRRGGSSLPDVMVAEAKPKKKKILAEIETIAHAPSETVQAPDASGLETSYFIQVGSFSNADNAARARDTFASVWPVQFIEFEGSNGPVYRVRLGPIASNSDAQTALDNAFAAGFSDARLIRAEAMQAALQ